MVIKMRYTIAQAAEKTGLSEHTIRYYEREGLLPFIERTQSGIRSFQDSDFEWLSLICCLKNTGMQIKEIKKFVSWCKDGDGTLEQRKEMLIEHRAAVVKQIADLNRYLENIDWKIDYYTEACESGRETPDLCEKINQKRKCKCF